MRSTDLYRYLDTVGDGTGTVQATGDYSAGQNFQFICPDTAKFVRIERAIIYIQDTGNFSSAGYGNLSALTNGIQVRTEKAGETMDITDGITVKSNGAWARECYDVTYLAFGSGDNILSVRWTFARAGNPILLDPGEKLIFYLEDDFSGLNEHTFKLNGQYKWK